MTHCEYEHPSEGSDWLDATWTCPHEPHETADRCLFHLSPAERADLGVNDDAVTEAFLERLRTPGHREKQFVGADLGRLTMDYQVLEGDTRYPVDLRGASVEVLSMAHTRLRYPLLLDGADVEEVVLDDARLVDGLSTAGTTFHGPVQGDELEVDGDADLQNATFAGPVTFEEATFDDDVWITEAQFEAPASFRGATFHGGSALHGETVSFEDVTFEAAARFEMAEFGVTDFCGADFEAVAGFQEATFAGDVQFPETTFHAEADFDEADFDHDADFDDATFGGPANFRGAEFSGDARVLEDDCTFERVAFEDVANFRNSTFRTADFADARFEARAMFEESAFGDDVTVAGATFADEADFDETRFAGDADFSDCRFEGEAVFRGAEFTGEANHLQVNVSFEGTRFEAAAAFDSASFTTANFLDVAFGSVADFEDAAFTTHLDFGATAIDGDTYVDMTDAHLEEGTIDQPDDYWMRYDLTRATLGEVSLTGEGAGRDLLDYFRFCETAFDGFDFSSHLFSLERNGWVLHEFDENEADFDYAVEMTPEATELTYLNAKNAASARGNQKAAGEFRVKRQLFARRKDLRMALDRDEDLSPYERAVKGTHAAENYFLGTTCGYGHRLARVITLFVLAPLPFGLLFTLGGPAFETEAGQVGLPQLATIEGAETLFRNTYFAYTSYTTVGYGDFSPLGTAARFVAISEAFVVVILSGLVLYSLIKRSEQ
jgi:hypothetical protein